MRYSRMKMKNRYNENKKISNSNQIKKCKLRKYKITQAGITIIALVITIIFSYDEFIKSSNNKGFLLQSI